MPPQSAQYIRPVRGWASPKPSGYRKLDEEKERLYQKYGEVKKELADYGIIKQNVDSILRVTPHQERTQEL